MNSPAQIEDYDSSQITVLEGLAPVKKRPGMYIGSTDRKGLHHMLWEITDNGIDEAMAGFCDLLLIELNSDGSVTVKDNGRGIPVDIHPEKQVSGATLIFTVLHAGGKFNGGAYKTSGGLHGVGASVVNALSEILIVRIARNGHIHEQVFRGGVPDQEMRAVSAIDSKLHGTSVTFKPDAQYFKDAVAEGGLDFDFDLICERMKQSSYLNPGLKIRVIDSRSDEKVIETFHSERGLVDMVEDHINQKSEQAIHPIQSVYLEQVGDIQISFAYAFTSQFKGSVRSFVNNIWTHDGGNHHQRFMQILAKSVSEYNHTKMGNNQSFSVNDIEDMVMGAISIRMTDPVFVGQTKGRLSSADAGRAVAECLEGNLSQFLEENPDKAADIIKKADAARRARLNAEKARAQVRRESAMSSLGTLPDKLADCQTKDRDISEVFLVEGDSAGGSAKQGRDRRFQAIMPLRGKITNIMKCADEGEGSEQIQNLKIVLGCWDENGFNLDKLRYGKVIIMTDADVDGAHIATLLLTFMMNSRELIENGHVYIAVPPLYRATKSNGETRYFIDEDEKRKAFPTEESLRGWSMQRFKGLGEMNPDQLWETAMDPETRHIVQLNIPSEELDEIEKTFRDLMGDNVEPRRQFLESQNCFSIESI